MAGSTPFSRRNRQQRVVTPRELHDAIRRGRYFFDSFMMDPVCFNPGSLTEPGLTALARLTMFTGRNLFEWSLIGTDHSAASQPALATEGGLNIVLSGSDVAGNGIELNFGGALAGHPRNCTPRITGGGGEDWFVRALLIIDDVSGCEVFLGYRTTGVAVATLTEVLNMSGIRILGDDSSALAAYSIVSNLDNSSTTDYASTALTNTLTDATLVELMVQARGTYARYFINGTEVATSLSNRFALDQRVSPVLRAIQQTDIAAQIKLLAVEGGALEFKSTETLQSLAGATA